MGMSKKSNDKKIKGWHYIPTVPLQVSPFFSFPLSPEKMWRWVFNRWLSVTENLIILIIATLTWYFWQPALKDVNAFSFAWIGQLWIRNFVLLAVVAGCLHWFFYVRKVQGKKLKYDPRDLSVKGRKFTLGSQVKDNMFWSLISGVGVWTLYETIVFWAMANSIAPVLIFDNNPIVFIVWFLLTPVWISFHFYWTHRLLHWPALYKLVHSVHHRNVNVGPWSGLSMHPIEHLIFFSSIGIHFIIPTDPLHVLFHMQHQALQAASSHTGYESMLVKDKKALALGTFHHQMHHRYFEVNYGTLEMPWDKWFGTFHDGTVEMHEKLKEQRSVKKV